MKKAKLKDQAILKSNLGSGSSGLLLLRQHPPMSHLKCMPSPWQPCEVTEIRIFRIAKRVACRTLPKMQNKQGTMTLFVHVLSSCQSLVFYYPTVGNLHSLSVVLFTSIFSLEIAHTANAFPLEVKSLLYGLCAPCLLFLQILLSHSNCTYVFDSRWPCKQYQVFSCFRYALPSTEFTGMSSVRYWEVKKYLL